jgi:hypothetical protein
MRFLGRLSVWLVGALFVAVSGGVTRAQTPADMAAAVAKTCAVMSGERKPDANAIQLLLLLDDDLADGNPLAIALYRGVVRECPKSYLAYEQRLRTHNPFANGSLTHGQTRLTNGSSNLTNGTAKLTGARAAEYPIRCRGGRGIASAQGKTLVLNFAKPAGAATAGLEGGQCSWIDRAVAANEPTTIEALLSTTAEAQNGVKAIDAGGTWTFWVVNTGSYLRASAIAKGTPAKKP